MDRHIDLESLDAALDVVLGYLAPNTLGSLVADCKEAEAETNHPMDDTLLHFLAMKARRELVRNVGEQEASRIIAALNGED